MWPTAIPMKRAANDAGLEDREDQPSPDCSWVQPILPPGDTGFPHNEVPSSESRRRFPRPTDPPPFYRGCIRQRRIGHKLRVRSLPRQIRETEEELSDGDGTSNKSVIADERDFENVDYGGFYREMRHSNIKVLHFLRCEISDSESIAELLRAENIEKIVMTRCLLRSPNGLCQSDCCEGVKRITFKNCAFEGNALLNWVGWFDEIISAESVSIEGSMISINAQNYLKRVTETISLIFLDCVEAEDPS